MIERCFIADASSRVQKGSYIPVKSSGKRGDFPPIAYGKFYMYFHNTYPLMCYASTKSRIKRENNVKIIFQERSRLVIKYHNELVPIILIRFYEF